MDTKMFVGGSTDASGRTDVSVKPPSRKQMSDIKTHAMTMRACPLSSKKKDYQYYDDFSGYKKKLAVNGQQQNCKKTAGDQMKIMDTQLLSVSQVQQMMAQHTGGPCKVTVGNGQRVLIRPNTGAYSNIISNDDGQITYFVRPKQNVYQISPTVPPSTSQAPTRSVARKRKFCSNNLPSKREPLIKKDLKTII